MSSNLFGSEIIGIDILEDLEFFDDWEDCYCYIIDLGKKFFIMFDELKIDFNFVYGCQSQVWISY